MLFYLWRRINERWMVSKSAALILGISAITSVAVTPIVFGQILVTDYSVASRIFWGIAGILTPLSIFFVWIGMWRYWVCGDHSRRIFRRLSFALLILGVWYGAVVYYFVVYLPQVKRRWSQS